MNISTHLNPNINYTLAPFFLQSFGSLKIDVLLFKMYSSPKAFFFIKTIRYGLTISLIIQVFAPVYEQSCCSDFRYESNGIFVLGVGFVFFRQISTF